MKAHMRPYVHDLTDDTVDAFVSDTRYDVLAGFGLCVDHVYVSSVNSVSQSQTVFFCFFFVSLCRVAWTTPYRQVNQLGVCFRQTTKRNITTQRNTET